MKTAKEILNLVCTSGHFAYASRPCIRSSSWILPALSFAEQAGTITAAERDRAESAISALFCGDSSVTEAHTHWQALYALIADFPDITAQDCPYVQREREFSNE